jgi:hypothetical protein
MNVRATRKGFYGGILYKEGAVFKLKDPKRDFSDFWMVDAATPVETKHVVKEPDLYLPDMLPEKVKEREAAKKKAAQEAKKKEETQK